MCLYIHISVTFQKLYIHECGIIDAHTYSCRSCTLSDSEHSHTSSNAVFQSPFMEGCYDGDVRLKGGMSSLEGRVEICQNNTYSSLCDDFWDELDAKVVCNQLEYSGDSKHIVLAHLTCVPYWVDSYMSNISG